MASNFISGTNFSLKSGTVDFFGAMGEHHGDYWLSNEKFGGNSLYQIHKENKVPESIFECIEADRNEGKDDCVAYVVVGRYAAVKLYLCGLVAIKHLRKASEGKDYIDIPGVVFGGLTLTVRVDANRDGYFCATADKDCTIIK